MNHGSIDEVKFRETIRNGTESILRRIVEVQSEKIATLEEQFRISNSTSISFDAKQSFYKDLTPKLQLLESKLKELQMRLSSTTTAGSKRAESQIVPPTPIVDKSSALDGGINDPSVDETGNKDISKEEILELTQTDFTSNINEARAFVLNQRETSGYQATNRPHHNAPMSDVDSEDHFGEHSMDGLRTPTQERDDIDDLGSFIEHNDSGLDIDQTFDEISDKSDVESNFGDSIRDELNDIQLSQDVAEKFGISYGNRPVEKDTIEEIKEDAMSISTEDDEIEEIEDFTTQLNEERELNNEVIEILSDDDDDNDNYQSNYQLPIKVEPISPKRNNNVCTTIDSDIDFSDDDDELMKIINGAPIPGADGREVPPGSEAFINDVYTTLNNVFKLKSFRQNQLRAISSLLQGKDVFVLMPTGGGKSLCYQLPALIQTGKTKGTTVVISPLISLMQDQVQHLLDKNIKAAMISSKATQDNNKNSLNLFRDGLLQLVYLSPEMANKSANVQRIITKLYENNQLARVVIDEAHCLSSWGHDFRPDYKGMSVFKEKYPSVPLMALTATANEKVRMDIVHHLKMNNPVLLKQSFNRSNLYYEIKLKDSTHLEWVKDYVLGKQRGKTGIIYCNTKQLCELTSEKLNAAGLKTSYYHAGMSSQERSTVQSMWQTGKLQLICATIAFGMGIDKADVRYVIHLCLPRTLEGYYQETGRAGRDGKHSDCIMFYSYRDARQIQSMIQRDEELTEEGKENHMEKLRQVVQYCSNTTDCRRKQVLHYFNENFDVQQCNKQCDNCKNNLNISVVLKDCTEYSRDILNLVQTIQHERVTVLQCQDIFKGSRSNKIIKMGHHNNPYHGKGKDLEKTDIERIFLDLLFGNYLNEYYIMRAGFASTYVQLGKNADSILKGQQKIKIQFSGLVKTNYSSKDASRPSTGASVSSKESLSNFRYTESFVSARDMQNSMNNLPLNATNDNHVAHSLQELNKIRVEILQMLTIPLRQVLDDITVRDMAAKLPTNKKDFAKLNGIARNQLDHFNHFKKILGSLSRERKKDTGPVSEYFNTQNRSYNQNSKNSSGNHKQIYKNSYNKQNNRSQSSRRSQKTTSQRSKPKGLPL
jgi:bloom syndrome protein